MEVVANPAAAAESQPNPRRRLEKKLATFATRVEAHALLGIAVWPTPHGPHPLGQ